MPYVSIEAAFDGFPLIDPRPYQDWLQSEGIENPVSGKANSFIALRGKEPSRAWVLMVRGDMLQLQSPLSSFDHVLTLTWGNRTITVQGLAIDYTEALTAVDVQTPETLYLLHLVDKRAVGPITDINNSYNVFVEGYPVDVEFFEDDSGLGTFFADSTDGGVAWEWETMLGDIASSIPFTLDTTEAEFPTDHPPINYRFHGVSAWDSYCKVLDDIHHTVVPKYTVDAQTGSIVFDGTFKVIPVLTPDPMNPLATTEFGADAQAAVGFLQSLSYTDLGTLPTIPEKVRVHFPKKDFAFQESSDPNIRDPKLHQINFPLHSVELLTADVAGFETVPTQTGTTKGIHAALIARYNDVGTLLNDTELQTAAEDLAGDWLRKTYFSDSYHHNIYDGIQVFRPGPQVEGVAWFDTGDGYYTEVIQSPRGVNLTGAPRSFAMPFRDVQDLYAQEHAGSPDLARHRIEPELFAIVELNENLTPYGCALANVMYRSDEGLPECCPTAEDPEQVVECEDPWSVTSADPFRVYETFGSSISSGARIPVKYHWQAHKWITFNPPGSPGLVVLATLSEDLCPGLGCVQVQCVTGLCAGSIAYACNPMQHTGMTGDVVALAPIARCGPGFTEDCDEQPVEGCPCLPCGDDPDTGEPFNPCASFTDDMSAQWVIIDIQKKQVCVVVDVERRDDCFVHGVFDLTAEYCKTLVCGKISGYACCDEEDPEDPTLCVDVDLSFPAGIEAGECCDEVCGCPNVPSVLNITITNGCGSVTFPIHRVGGSGPCAVKFVGTGNLNCRVDAFTPCGNPVLVRMTLCSGINCEISMECFIGGGFDDVSTASFDFSTCEPLYGSITTFPLPGDCGLCQTMPGEPITITITE